MPGVGGAPFSAPVVLKDVTKPGRGGRGGGLVDAAGLGGGASGTTVCGREGRAGGDGSTAAGAGGADAGIFPCPLTSLLPASEGCWGGGSKATGSVPFRLRAGTPGCGGLAGRLGSVGTTGSGSGLLGGLLNGDLAAEISSATSRRRPLIGEKSCDSRLLGFSARFIGGGTTGLFISPERRGGGGDGGLTLGVRPGERRGSTTAGVCGLLGILKGRGGEEPSVVAALVGSTASWLLSPLGARLVPLPFGGDWGGSTRTAGGGFIGLGLMGDGLATRGAGTGTWSFGAGFGLGSSRGVGVVRVGLVSGTGGGFGDGERLRAGAGGGTGVDGVEGTESFPRPMFSNWARREETGFSDEPSGPSPAWGSMEGLEGRYYAG